MSLLPKLLVSNGIHFRIRYVGVLVHTRRGPLRSTLFPTPSTVYNHVNVKKGRTACEVHQWYGQSLQKLLFSISGGPKRALAFVAADFTLPSKFR